MYAYVKLLIHSVWCEDFGLKRRVWRLVLHTNSHHICHKYLFWESQSSLKYLIPEMQRHVLSSPSQRSETREVMPGSGDPEMRPGFECIKYLLELGTSIKFSWMVCNTASLWFYKYILCIYGNSYKLPVELSIFPVWLFFFLYSFTPCVELDFKILCNIFFRLAKNYCIFSLFFVIYLYLPLNCFFIDIYHKFTIYGNFAI